MNLGGQDFLDISYLTGADSDGDGRSVVAGDFRNTGQMDLVVRQATGQVVPGRKEEEGGGRDRHQQREAGGAESAVPGGHHLEP